MHPLNLSQSFPREVCRGIRSRKLILLISLEVEQRIPAFVTQRATGGRLKVVTGLLREREALSPATIIFNHDCEKGKRRREKTRRCAYVYLNALHTYIYISPLSQRASLSSRFYRWAYSVGRFSANYFPSRIPRANGLRLFSSKICES